MRSMFFLLQCLVLGKWSLIAVGDLFLIKRVSHWFTAALQDTEFVDFATAIILHTSSLRYEKHVCSFSKEMHNHVCWAWNLRQHEILHYPTAVPPHFVNFPSHARLEILFPNEVDQLWITEGTSASGSFVGSRRRVRSLYSPLRRLRAHWMVWEGDNTKSFHTFRHVVSCLVDEVWLLSKLSLVQLYE